MVSIGSDVIVPDWSEILHLSDMGNKWEYNEEYIRYSNTSRNCTGFKLGLKDFLCCHSFYTLEEYFDFDYDKKNI
jgi:hypothetical protein